MGIRYLWSGSPGSTTGCAGSHRWSMRHWFRLIICCERLGEQNVELSTDGVHLTAKGYGILASAVRAQLPKHLRADATILCFGDSLTYGIGVRPPNSLLETGNSYPEQLRALLNK